MVGFEVQVAMMLACRCDVFGSKIPLRAARRCLVVFYLGCVGAMWFGCSVRVRLDVFRLMVVGESSAVLV